MIIGSCSKCSKYLDTDFSPDVYREEFDYICLCDKCYEAKIEELERNYDGALYCDGCKAKTHIECTCGPIADNN